MKKQKSADQLLQGAFFAASHIINISQRHIEYADSEDWKTIFGIASVVHKHISEYMPLMDLVQLEEIISDFKESTKDFVEKNRKAEDNND